MSLIVDEELAEKAIRVSVQKKKKMSQAKCEDILG